MGFESDETVEHLFSLQIQMHFRFTKYKTNKKYCSHKFTWYWGLNQMRQQDIKSKWNTFTRRKIHSTGNIYERYKQSCYLSSRHYLRKCSEHSVLCLWITLKHLTLRSILPLVGNVYWRDFPVKLFQHPRASRWQGNLAEYFSSGTWPSISVGQPDQGHMYQLGNLTKHLSWATWLGFSGFCGALQERHSGLHAHLSTSYHH